VRTCRVTGMAPWVQVRALSGLTAVHQAQCPVASRRLLRPLHPCVNGRITGARRLGPAAATPMVPLVSQATGLL
jgi:hypothetical protein